jgi:hypothetical protein
MNPTHRAGQVMIGPLAIGTVPQMQPQLGEQPQPGAQPQPIVQGPMQPQLSSVPIGNTTGMETGNPPSGVPYYGLSPTGQPLDQYGYPIVYQGMSGTTVLLLLGGAALIWIVASKSSRGGVTLRNPFARRRARRRRLS